MLTKIGKKAPPDAQCGTTGVYAKGLAGFAVQTGGCYYGDRYRFEPIPIRHYDMLEAALRKVHAVAKTDRCAAVFGAIAHGKSLQQIIDAGVGLSWCTTSDFYGSAPIGFPNVALTPSAFEADGIHLLPTLVHEIAHVGGVRVAYKPNDRFSHFRAYQAEMECTGSEPDDVSDDQLEAIRAFPIVRCGTCLGRG